ncbi:hypothetical protein AKJ16_DCAP24572 [Drosera capensis]
MKLQTLIHRKLIIFAIFRTGWMTSSDSWDIGYDAGWSRTRADLFCKEKIKSIHYSSKGALLHSTLPEHDRSSNIPALNEASKVT